MMQNVSENDLTLNICLRSQILGKYSPIFFIKCCLVGKQLFCHSNLRITFLFINLDSEYITFLQGENTGFKFLKWY